MRSTLLILRASVVTGGLILLSLWTFGPRGARFAFVVVWLPMTSLGTVGHLVRPRLPDSYHDLRSFDGDGHVQEMVGVRAAKWLLRRGPLRYTGRSCTCDWSRPTPRPCLDRHVGAHTARKRADRAPTCTVSHVHGVARARGRIAPSVCGCPAGRDSARPRARFVPE